MYHLTIIFLALVIVSCKESFNPNEFIIVSDCKVLDATNGDILHKYPGSICEYDQNGHTYAYSINIISKIAIKDQSLVWSASADVHHDLGYDSEKKVLYALERESFSRNGTIFLGLKVLGREAHNGQVTFEWKSSEHQRELFALLTISADKYTPLLPPRPSLTNHPADTRLYLDANQIDVLNSGHPLLADKRFKRGDLLISFMDHSTLAILKTETLELIEVARIPSSQGQIHTASFNNENSLSVFINQVVDHHNHSAAVEFKLPHLEEIVWKYPPELTPNFFSPFFSSVQKISDELYFIVDNTTGKVGHYFIDREGNIVHKIMATGNEETLLSIYRAQAFSKDKLYLFIGP